MNQVKKAIFPVAGLGTRFLPATKAQPKEMLPLVDKPIIQYAVEEALEAGLSDIIFVTGRGKRAIEDYFDHSFELEHFLAQKGKFELLKQIEEISQMALCAYIRQKEPLGLGHAVLCAKDICNGQPVGVFLPDDVILAKPSVIQQLLDIYQDVNASVLAVMEVPKKEVSRYGIVGLDPNFQTKDGRLFKINNFLEKPSPEKAPSSLAIIGRYILSPGIFPALLETKPDAAGEIQLTNGLKILLKKEPVFAYRFEGERFDAGEILGWLKATIALALRRPALKKDLKAFLKTL